MTKKMKVSLSDDVKSDLWEPIVESCRKFPGRLYAHVNQDQSVFGKLFDEIAARSSTATGLPIDRFVVFLTVCQIMMAYIVFFPYSLLSTFLVFMITAGHPIAKSVVVMELGNGIDQAVWLLYWILFVIGQTCCISPPIFNVLVFLYLSHPITFGVHHLYHRLLRPFILLQHRQLNMVAFSRLYDWIWKAMGIVPEQIALQLLETQSASEIREGLERENVRPDEMAVKPSAPGGQGVGDKGDFDTPTMTAGGGRSEDGGRSEKTEERSPVNLCFSPSEYRRLLNASITAIKKSSTSNPSDNKEEKVTA